MRYHLINVLSEKFYLFTDEAEAPVLSDTLVGLPQHRVKGLVAVSERRRGVTGDSEGGHVNLEEIKCKSGK